MDNLTSKTKIMFLLETKDGESFCIGNQKTKFNLRNLHCNIRSITKLYIELL